MRYIKSCAFLILIVILLTFLPSCKMVEDKYQIPVFDIMKEKHKTILVEREDILVKEDLKVNVETNKLHRFTFEYKENEGYGFQLIQAGSRIEKDQVLAEVTSFEMERELRLKEEDLELKELLYEDLFKAYSESNEGYYSMQLALLDVEEARFNLNKVKESYSHLKITSPVSGYLDKVSESYKFEKDEFGNQIKTTVVTFSIIQDSIFLSISSANNEIVDALLKDVFGFDDILKIYDNQDIEYKAKVVDVETNISFNYRQGTWLKSILVSLEFVKDSSIDYSQVIKSPLYYPLIIEELSQVISLKKDLILTNEANENYVYVLQNDIKSIRYIKLGRQIQNASFVVIDGLYEGDLVVTETYLEK